MAIQIIAWVIGGVVATVVTGSLVAAFWDEIKSWATRMLGYILDGIVKGIEVTSSAITSLIKKGRHIYKMIEVYVKNTRTGGIRRDYQQEEIYEDDIPEDIRNELHKREKLEVLRQST